MKPLSIIPLECEVDDLTFERVRRICGEEAAWDLCYVDKEAYRAIQEAISILTGGHDHVRERKESRNEQQMV